MFSDGTNQVTGATFESYSAPTRCCLSPTTTWRRLSQGRTSAAPIAKTVVDAYAWRISFLHWANEDQFRDVESTLQAMSLSEFATRFYIPRGLTKIHPRPDKSKNFMVFKPCLSPNPESATYPEFCRLSLVRHKPWSVDRNNLWSGTDHPTNEDYIQAWVEFVGELVEAGKEVPERL